MGSVSFYSPFDVRRPNLVGVRIVFQETAITLTPLKLNILPPPGAGQLEGLVWNKFGGQDPGFRGSWLLRSPPCGYGQEFSVERDTSRV